MQTHDMIKECSTALAVCMLWQTQITRHRGDGAAGKGQGVLYQVPIKGGGIATTLTVALCRVHIWG